MAKTSYLFRRNNFYYFHIRMPAEYQDSLNAREITKSLKLKIEQMLFL